MGGKRNRRTVEFVVGEIWVKRRADGRRRVGEITNLGLEFGYNRRRSASWPRVRRDTDGAGKLEEWARRKSYYLIIDDNSTYVLDMSPNE